MNKAPFDTYRANCPMNDIISQVNVEMTISEVRKGDALVFRIYTVIKPDDDPMHAVHGGIDSSEFSGQFLASRLGNGSKTTRAAAAQSALRAMADQIAMYLKEAK